MKRIINWNQAAPCQTRYQHSAWYIFFFPSTSKTFLPFPQNYNVPQGQRGTWMCFFVICCATNNWLIVSACVCLSSCSYGDRAVSLCPCHWEAPKLCSQHSRSLYRLDLCCRTHHGGQLPGTEIIILLFFFSIKKKSETTRNSEIITKEDIRCVPNPILLAWTIRILKKYAMKAVFYSQTQNNPNIENHTLTEHHITIFSTTEVVEHKYTQHTHALVYTRQTSAKTDFKKPEVCPGFINTALLYSFWYFSTLWKLWNDFADPTWIFPL